MRIWVDTAVPAEIEEWNEHPWVSGFTTNPTLFRQSGATVADVVKLTTKPISIDGPPEKVWALGEHVIPKVVVGFPLPVVAHTSKRRPLNWTAICSAIQIQLIQPRRGDVFSVFAGRIADTGRDPVDLIRKLRAEWEWGVLWASVREPANIRQAEAAGCELVTVPPAILRKYLEWHGKPLEVVAEETIQQFRDDGAGMAW